MECSSETACHVILNPHCPLQRPFPCTLWNRYPLTLSISFAPVVEWLILGSFGVPGDLLGGRDKTMLLHKVDASFHPELSDT